MIFALLVLLLVTLVGADSGGDGLQYRHTGKIRLWWDERDTGLPEGIFKWAQGVLGMPVQPEALGKATSGEVLVAEAKEYNHLILIAKQLPASVKAADIVRFVEAGGDLLWALPPGPVDREIAGLAGQFGRILSTEPTRLVDHFAKLSFGSANEHVFSEDEPIVVAEKISAHQLDPRNPLVFPILTAASPTAQLLVGETVLAQGSDVVLASGLDARNGARIVMVSAVLDEGWDAASRLVMWAFHEMANLKLTSLEHWSVDGGQSAAVDPLRHPSYPVDSLINVKVCLQIEGRRSYKDSLKVQKPFLVKDDDQLQVELFLMDPQVRVTLVADPSSACHQNPVPIRLPSRYGVYRLRLRYQRHGISHIIHQEEVTIRPLRHNQYPRFLLRAMPYYASWLLGMTGTLLAFIPLLLLLSKAKFH